MRERLLRRGRGKEKRTFERRIASLGYFFAACAASGASIKSVRNAGYRKGRNCILKLKALESCS